MPINLNIYNEEDANYGQQFDPQNPQDQGISVTNPPPSDENQYGDSSLGQQDPSQDEQDPSQQGMEDITDDPNYPDMPDENRDVDFEVWKREFFELTLKNNAEELIDHLHMVKDLEGLDKYQSKFVEDNFNIQLIRRLSNVQKASTDIRRNIKSSIDKSAPTISLMSYINSALDEHPMLSEMLIKMEGYKDMKGDLHRKFIAALCCAVQVGSGQGMEDIIYNERDFSMSISTRLNSKWGNTMIGPWSLKEDDPARFLEEVELQKLTSGSPEEKQVLRRRVVVESISEQFSDRGFIINCIDDDGTVHSLAWDLGASIKNAYIAGKLIVKTRKSDNSEAIITDDGKILPMIDLRIMYRHDTGELDINGDSVKENKEFLDRREGRLFLTASVETLKEASGTLSNMVFHERPYNGNPSDINKLRKCTYSSYDLLNRQC